MLHLRGEYDFALNSADLLDPELPLVKAKAHGGTMVMWKQVGIIPPTSARLHCPCFVN